MNEQTIRRVSVWSGALRALHWLVALAVLFLLFTGGVMRGLFDGYEPGLASAHRNMGVVLLALLAVRLYLLLFGARAEHWRDLLPGPAQRAALPGLLRFYLSWGRAPLPAYYAHNPLWGPVYLLLYVVLLAQGVTGLMGEMAWHAVGAVLIGGLSVLHVLAVFLQDWKGDSSEVSAMISGYKVFVVKRPEGTTQVGAQPVSLDRYRKKEP